MSGSPALNGVGEGDFSNNSAAVEGKYFLENATLLGNIGFDRHVIHYYGYDSDKFILAKDKTRQLFSTFGTDFRLNSRFSDPRRLQYNGRFAFSTTNDLFDATESEFIVSGGAGKQKDNLFAALDVSFDYFKKTDGSFALLTNTSNLSRNIVNIQPSVTFNKEKAILKVGVDLGIEKNQGTDLHLFPRAERPFRSPSIS